MFDIKSIGHIISAFRKERDLTQMELAEMIGISFQAVSSWERGETMPDISAKDIEECASILKPSQINGLVEKIKGKISISEIIELAPFIGQETLDNLAMNAVKNGKIVEITNIAPFLSKETLDWIAEKIIEEASIKGEELIPRLLPLQDTIMFSFFKRAKSL